jgi:hypothetical protein
MACAKQSLGTLGLNTLAKKLGPVLAFANLSGMRKDVVILI